ncbi:MAG: hypothetical protein QNK11_04370, partial [Legionella sp.]|nr:hypothetical protein [Legionella sp.]
KWTILSMSILSILALIFVFPLIIKQKNFVPQNTRFFHHNRQLLNHIRDPKIFIATIIGGLNFAILISTYTIMGFKLSAPPISLPASITSLIFLCYLGGTLSSQLSGLWNKHYSSLAGIFVGTLVCFIALMVLFVESMFAIFIGLFLLSSGAFFIHSLAYGYVGKNVKQGKSTATALYLVMYYSGSSIGGFVLIYCWQIGAWSLVFMVATITYLIMSILNFSLVKQSQADMRACVN